MGSHTVGPAILLSVTPAEAVFQAPTPDGGEAEIRVSLVQLAGDWPVAIGEAVQLEIGGHRENPAQMCTVTRVT